MNESKNIESYQKIHQRTNELKREANKILKKNDWFWYSSFYSGSLSPKILFLGYNPGYSESDFPKRNHDYEEKIFSNSKIKYIDESGTKLSKKVYKLLSYVLGTDIKDQKIEGFLKEHVAETNLFHFNTPRVSYLEDSMRKLDPECREKLYEHFYGSLKTVIEITKPQLIFINGKGTWEDIFNFSKRHQKDHQDHLRFEACFLLILLFCSGLAFYCFPCVLTLPFINPSFNT